MALPRSKYVQENTVGVYHCFCRCVRRAFLHGFDKETGKDFSHRKQWIKDRLRFLSTIFAIEVITFSIMDNHYHTVVRTRPDIVDTWSDTDVATRWLILCPNRYRSKNEPPPSNEEQIQNLASNSVRIAELRKRLSSLSWFMKHINEFVAREANKEDDVKGRFWESRFKCQALLDEAAITACMVYVDLNPIRAGLAPTPEQSDFTGIQHRIHCWQAEGKPRHSDWLCPISSRGGISGILSISTEEYFKLIDGSGRVMRSDKRGTMEANLVPILTRIGANPDTWKETVSGFGDRFCLVVGLVSNIRKFARQLGQRWFAGLSAASVAFSSRIQ